MKMIVKPDPNYVGKYIAFIEDYKSIKKKFFQKNNNIHKAYIESDKKINLNYFKNIELIALSKNNIIKVRKEKQIIPKWISSEENFKRILFGKWNKILPITAEFVPTLNCNFRCTQCSYIVPKKKIGVWTKNLTKFCFNFRNKNIHTNLDTTKQIIDKLVAGGVKNILFTGGGEPFINPSVTLEGMHYAKEKGMVIGLYSNGSLLSQEIIKSIFEINPLFVRISIYGSNPNSFSIYTKQSKNVYEKVLQNIKLLAQEKINRKSSTQIGLSYLIHPYTIQDINQLDKYLLTILSPKELKTINSCRFTPAVDYYGGKQHPQEIFENTFSYIEQKIKPSLEKYGINVKLYYHRLNDLNKKRTYKNCRASGWYLEVGPSGEVYLCCEKLFSLDSKIGDLKIQSINEIYNSSLRRKIINRINKCGCSECPPVCKPHELNKIFNDVDSLIINGQRDVIKKWRNDLLVKSYKTKHFFGKLNDFES